MQIEVSVTQDNIDQGVMCNRGACPISLALYDMGGEFVDVGWVATEGAFCARFFYEGDGWASRLPLEADTFAGMFDAGKNVEPFKFNLNAEKV